MTGDELIKWAKRICEEVYECPPSDSMLLVAIRGCSDVAQVKWPSPKKLSPQIARAPGAAG